MKLVKTILNQYSKELEEAVKTLDVVVFRKFYAKRYFRISAIILGRTNNASY